jgi:hypothetical protein
MKRFFQTIFVLIALGCSSAAAEQFSIGFGLESFALADPNLRVPLRDGIPIYAISTNLFLDFDSDSSGPGVRLGIKAGSLVLVGIGLDLYYRMPVPDQQSNVYLGTGISGNIGFFNDWLSYSEVHGLLGVEIPLLERAAFFVEMMPGVIFSGEDSKFSWNVIDQLDPSHSLAGSFILKLALGVRIIFR